MALSKDTPIPLSLGEFSDHPVLTNVKIFEGALVTIDANGFAKPLAGTDPFFAGIAHRQADNTGGASGAIKVRTRRGVHWYEVTLSGAAQANVGDTLYASDDGTFTLTSTNNKEVGKVAEFRGGSKILARLSTDV